MSVKEILNRKIYTIDNFLTEDECSILIDLFPSRIIINSISEDSGFSKAIWKLIEYKVKDLLFGELKITGIQESVTITKINSFSPIQKHKDSSVLNAEWKLFIYLNKVSGTTFYHTDKEIPIYSEAGKAVLFHISLEHESQPIPEKSLLKYVIGVRPLLS